MLSKEKLNNKEVEIWKSAIKLRGRLNAYEYQDVRFVFSIAFAMKEDRNPLDTEGKQKFMRRVPQNKLKRKNLND